MGRRLATFPVELSAIAPEKDDVLDRKRLRQKQRMRARKEERKKVGACMPMFCNYICQKKKNTRSLDLHKRRNKERNRTHIRRCEDAERSKTRNAVKERERKEFLAKDKWSRERKDGGR